MNFRVPLRFLGRLVLLLAATNLAPALCSAFYGEWKVVVAFLLSSLITAIVGAIMVGIGGEKGESYRREGILVVVGGWVLASFFGAIPYLLAGTFSSPIDALFESASGFTTTGASVMTTIEGHALGILFWRCFTQWLGGMGIIVLFVALLPELGPGARFLYKLEVPGPTSEALGSRITHTAGVLWKIYLLLSGAETVLLMACGMNLYDALTHTFSTMSTGGFSPRNASVAAFQSPLVEIVIIIFMVLAGTNFSLFYGLRRRRGWNLYRDPEFRLYLNVMLGIGSGHHFRPAAQGCLPERTARRAGRRIPIGLHHYHDRLRHRRLRHLARAVTHADRRSHVRRWLRRLDGRLDEGDAHADRLALGVP